MQYNISNKFNIDIMYLLLCCTMHRLSCESDTTPNTTPEERRRRAQSEVKPTPINKQQNYHRSRTSIVNAHNKESVKKSEPIKPRAASISRTDSTRLSMRAPKSSQVSVSDLSMFYFSYTIS